MDSECEFTYEIDFSRFNCCLCVCRCSGSLIVLGIKREMENRKMLVKFSVLLRIAYKLVWEGVATETMILNESINKLSQFIVDSKFLEKQFRNTREKRQQSLQSD